MRVFVCLCFDGLVHKGSLIFAHRVVQPVRSPNMSDVHLYSVRIVSDQPPLFFFKN